MKKQLILLTISILILFCLGSSAQGIDTNRFKKQEKSFGKLKPLIKLVALTFDDGPDPVYTPKYWINWLSMMLKQPFL